MQDNWTAADAYEAFMGRWSRLLAERFVQWLDTESDLVWLEVGCGTGALTSAIYTLASPASIIACDPSAAFAAKASEQLKSERVSIVIARSGHLPQNDYGFDCVVSGLVLNFLDDPRLALREMKARARHGATVAAYVWDYAGRTEFLRVFWDEAVVIDPAARSHDEGVRFPLCEASALAALFRDGGLRNVSSAPLEIATHFESFDDYWRPFLAGTGPAPSYVASLSTAKRDALRERLQRRLAPQAAAGAIELVARAWAVRGTV